VQIALLGPLEVRDDASAPITLPGVRLRTLLARLALDAGRPVTADALIDAVWGDTPPSGALNALQTLVSRLRRALPPADAALLRSLPTGYRLDVPVTAVDTARFEHCASVRDIAGALSLRRGELLADLGPPEFARATAARLSALQLGLLEDRRADPGMIPELDALIAAHPYREGLHAPRIPHGGRRSPHKARGPSHSPKIHARWRSFVRPGLPRAAGFLGG
jgi:DNA-binding SARP family transcriptional activator